ncbi:molybdopterin molybdotransferase [Lentzea atacamensis]|uniref:Molybdopterin molybdenumtransferase n=1 Tax=Lentzea atacamensis TaxID=531938 RepID=A0A316I4K2_9PSEU|nr:molybdopterin molybdotransferase MoeA [Lentzea atacamensis]PWK88326.1 molybdopterin molybdotransferase [Lentzea atacamensis]
MNMPWNLARQTAREAAKPLEAVEVALPDALGLALASGVRALASQPTCDTSAMDGYAVAGPGPWTVVARVAAGDPVPGVRLRAGEAFGVATGAPVPDGSDSVIPVELCSVEAGVLREAAGGAADRRPGESRQAPNRPPGDHGESHQAPNRPPGKHIRRRGEDWSAGDELVPAGSLVSAAVLGLASGAGHDTLLVHRRPRVAVVVTGDELLHAGPPRPGRVRDAIGPMLPGLLTGADLFGTTHLRDDPSALADALTFDQADVLVTCGATSVGPADHLRRVLADLDAEVLVSGVACRPGHPMLLAVLPDGRCVAGLPGNPFAALAAVLTLLRPLLDTLGGQAIRAPVTAWLGDAGAHPHDTRLVPVTRAGVPVGHDRPGSLWGAALADALAVVPPGHRGGEVELLPL